MTAAADDLHTAWAELFAAALAQCGVAHAAISPGSRSTPLALALAAVLPSTVLHDERVAAFFALGHARASGRAAVVLATSGTAPGHWLPAAMEAHEAGLPLLLLSADRPWEVQHAQASQTVDQQRLFGHHANAYFELGLPDPHPAALRAVGRIAAQAVLATHHPQAGAVHVNARFRKPLEPQAGAGREPWRAAYGAVAAAGAPVLWPPHAAPDPRAVTDLVAQVRAAPCGVVVAGPVPAWEAAPLRAAVLRFIAASGYVLLAEAASQLRFAPGVGERACGAFDAILRDADVRTALQPQLAIEVGAPPVSAQWLAWIDGDRPPARWVLPGARPADPAGGAAGMLLGPVAGLLDAAAAQLEGQGPGDDGRATAFRARWAAAEAAAWAARDAALRGPAFRAGLEEAHIAPLLRAALPAGAWLAVGNSGPVRDLDHDLPPDAATLTLLHQRGAAGIDGLVSGAAGARTALNAAHLAAGSNRPGEPATPGAPGSAVARTPLALLLGDVSLLHDAGGLAAAAAVPGPLAIVVVNNDGGRIFERLPLGRDAALVAARERLFVTPHGRSFDALAATWGLAYARADTPGALADAIATAVTAGRPMVVEAVPRAGGSDRRAELLGAMAAAARRALQT